MLSSSSSPTDIFPDMEIPRDIRDGTAFADVPVLYFRYVIRLSSRRSMLDRVLLVTRNGVSYLADGKGRVTRTWHGRDVPEILTDCTDAADRVLIRVRNQSDVFLQFSSVSALGRSPAQATLGYYLRVLKSFNPQLQVQRSDLGKNSDVKMDLGGGRDEADCLADYLATGLRSMAQSLEKKQKEICKQPSRRASVDGAPTVQSARPKSEISRDAAPRTAACRLSPDSHLEQFALMSFYALRYVGAPLLQRDSSSPAPLDPSTRDSGAPPFYLIAISTAGHLALWRRNGVNPLFTAPLEKLQRIVLTLSHSSKLTRDVGTGASLDEKGEGEAAQFVFAAVGGSSCSITVPLCPVDGCTSISPYSAATPLIEQDASYLVTCCRKFFPGVAVERVGFEARGAEERTSPRRSIAPDMTSFLRGVDAMDSGGVVGRGGSGDGEAVSELVQRLEQAKQRQQKARAELQLLCEATEKDAATQRPYVQSLFALAALIHEICVNALVQRRSDATTVSQPSYCAPLTSELNAASAPARTVPLRPRPGSSRRIVTLPADALSVAPS